MIYTCVILLIWYYKLYIKLAKIELLEKFQKHFKSRHELASSELKKTAPYDNIIYV